VSVIKAATCEKISQYEAEDIIVDYELNNEKIFAIIATKKEEKEVRFVDIRTINKKQLFVPFATIDADYIADWPVKI